MKQIPLAIGIDAPATFESFLPGANGAALQRLGNLPDPAAPIYLWGPPGCGKTHLLHALVHECEQRGERSGWFGCLDPLPWRFDEAWSLLVFDDCDGLDAERQHAAFSLFVDAATHAVPVAAAGNVPPVDLPLREDLRSRLGWGHVFAIAPLTETETRAALRRAADQRGLFLSDDLMGYLLSRFARDLKALMTLLDRLDRFALAERRAVTVPLLKQMLAEEAAAA